MILGWAANYMFLGGSMVQSRARLPKSIVVIMDVGSNPTQGKFCNTISKYSLYPNYRDNKDYSEKPIITKLRRTLKKKGVLIT